MPAPNPIKLYKVVPPLVGEETGKPEYYKSKMLAKRRYRALKKQLQDLTRRMKVFPKGTAPGDPAPIPPQEGQNVVILREVTIERGKVGDLLADALSGTLNMTTTPLDSYEFLNPFTEKAESAA